MCTQKRATRYLLESKKERADGTLGMKKAAALMGSIDDMLGSSPVFSRRRKMKMFDIPPSSMGAGRSIKKFQISTQQLAGT